MLSKSESIAAASFVIASLTLIASFMVPEVRQSIGLEPRRTTKSHTAERPVTAEFVQEPTTVGDRVDTEIFTRTTASPSASRRTDSSSLPLEKEPPMEIAPSNVRLSSDDTVEDKEISNSDDNINEYIGTIAEIDRSEILIALQNGAVIGTTSTDTIFYWGDRRLDTADIRVNDVVSIKTRNTATTTWILTLRVIARSR
jgi:hypothetical protein